MNILIVSDTHGREKNLRSILEKHGMPDYLIHLGDSEGGADRIRELVTCPLAMVAGNCDFFCDLPRVAIVELGGYRAMVTHGHYHFVAVGTKELVHDAKLNGCNVVMFGHTHKPLIDQSDPEITVLNPGSLSFPRQQDRRPSYIMMVVEEGKEAEYELCYI